MSNTELFSKLQFPYLLWTLIAFHYKQTITGIGTKINKSNYETAVKIASIPDQIRGFGHVKEKNIKEAINYRTDLLNSFHENT